MTPIEIPDMLRKEGLCPPKTLTLSITGCCNIACRHCWVDAGTATATGHAPEPVLRRLITEFAAVAGTGIRLTGGEPLCHPGWLGLVRLARTTGFSSITLQTNAMLVTDSEVSALRALDFPGLTIQVSLDGATAPAHDLVRGNGSHKAALEGIHRLVAGGLGPRLAIFFTEMRHNLAEIPALLELADDMSISSVTTGTLVRCGRAEDSAAVTPPDPAQFLELLDRYDSDPDFRERYDRIGTMAALEWRKATPRTECCTFVENPYLTPDGTLFPCLLCHTPQFSVTGVFEKGLTAAFTEGAPLWSSLRQTSSHRADTLAGCQDCPERQACAGGCMGRAWGSCGDLRAPDDRCQARRAISRRKRPGNGT